MDPGGCDLHLGVAAGPLRPHQGHGGQVGASGPGLAVAPGTGSCGHTGRLVIRAAQTTHAWTSGEQINLSPWLSPDPTLSSSGDYATDTYGDPWKIEDPILGNANGDVTFRSSKYVVGGYRGLYDFSKDRTKLVKDFLVRAANESKYERLYENGWFAPDEGSAYRQIKQPVTWQMSRTIPIEKT